MSLGQRIDEVREGFERSFWVANVSEIFERLAYYGSFASLANYLRETLNFPTQQTGTLTGIFGGMVCCTIPARRAPVKPPPQSDRKWIAWFHPYA